jgi:hypothetical protein
MNVGTLQTNGGGATDRPDRYTSSTTAIGNFASLELNGPNGATPQTLTMGYLDQNGVSRTSNPVTIPAGGGDRQINFTPPLFCVPLLTGHGITKVESLQFNVGSGSAGTYDVFMGHLLSYIPLPVQNVPVHMEGLLQGFNLPYVFNSACLSFIEIPNGTNSAYNGQLSFAAG